MMANTEIIVGTYEGFLLGYGLEKGKGKNVLIQSFADKSHSSALKCLALQGRWIATGGTDDRIFIYDMKSRKQSQILLNHNGTINSLAFTPDETHLLSGGDDGLMIAVRVNTWLPEATWKKAHSGSAVTHITCHPSGKLALSLGSDLVLCTWNLVKGRVAYKTNLRSKSTTLGTMPDCLSLSPSGDYFTLAGKHVVEIWSIKTADVIKSQQTNSKPICVSWIRDEECLFGLEDGKILWIGVNSAKTAAHIDAHSARVKAIFYRDNILATAASSGEIKMWEVITKELNIIATINIGCRPTCIAILGLDQFGADYTINNNIKEKSKVENKRAKAITNFRAERGTVTIEFEDGEEEDNSNISVENKNDSSSEKETEKSERDTKHEDENEENSSDSQDSTNSECPYNNGELGPYRPKANRRKKRQLSSKVKSNNVSSHHLKTSVGKRPKKLPKFAAKKNKM